MALRYPPAIAVDVDKWRQHARQHEEKRHYHIIRRELRPSINAPRGTFGTSVFD